jgi:hypothetical protein
MGPKAGEAKNVVAANHLIETCSPQLRRSIVTQLIEGQRSVALGLAICGLSQRRRKGTQAPTGRAQEAVGEFAAGALVAIRNEPALTP